MPLYNRLLEREDVKDEDKKHYQFWEDVEKSPVGKASKWLNRSTSFDTSPEQRQLYRSGEKGKVLQGLQYLNDALDVTQTVVGLPVQALGWTFNTAAEGLSDATGYDKRSINTALTIAGLSKAKVIPKGSRLHRSIQTAGQQAGARAGTQARHLKTNLKQAKTFYDERFSPDPSKRVVDVTSQKLDSIFNMPPAEIQKIIRLANQPGINSLTLARRLNQQQGVIKTYLDSKGKTDLTEGAKDLKASLEVPDEWELIKWSNYGYTPDTQPTQVSKASPLFVEQVANSLDSFYSRTQEAVISKVGSKASAKEIRQALKEFPQFWVNPEGGKIYRASYTTGLQKRYTIKPVARQFLEKQQSTALQKKWNSWFQKDIQTRNKLHKEAYDKEFDATQKELKEVQETIQVYRKKGESGPDMQRAQDRIAELNTKIDNLEYGREYTEHGLYLQSEKGRNYILDNSGVPLNESKEFSLGDIDNQTARLENLNNPDTLVFRKFKSRLETVLDESPGNYFSYPNYIVNSNPRLSGGRDDVIRIEYSPIEWQEVPGTDQMRPVLSDFKIKDGILSGKNVNVKTIDIKKDLPALKEYFSRGFNDETIRQWLSEVHGITPVSQDQSIPRTGFNIRLSKSPMKSRQEQIKEFKKLMEDVQAGRKTWDEVFAEEGIEIVPQTEDVKVKGKGGRPKGSRTKVKGEKGETFLDKLNNAFKGWE